MELHAVQNTLLVLLLAAPPLTEAEKTYVRELEVSPGQRIRLDLDTGAEVQVTGWDESRVRVHVGLAGRDWERTGLTVEPDSDGVRVSMKHKSHGEYSTSHWIQLQVPRRFNLELHSAGGGLMISDVEGTFRGGTGGGALILTNLKGNAELNTGGGEIAVTDSTLDGRVNTGGGAVKLLRVQGGLRANSGGGPVVHETSETDPIEMSSAGGDILIKEAPRGANVNTGGGSIRIGRSAGVVTANTGGGDVEIGPTAGSVKASTGGGNIRVTLSNKDGRVDVASGNGSISITVPDSFDGVVDLETAYTRSHGTPTKIVSGWSLPIETTDTWDDRNGSPMRYVRARSRLGSGTGVIRVRTTNGDISILGK